MHLDVNDSSILRFPFLRFRFFDSLSGFLSFPSSSATSLFRFVKRLRLTVRQGGIR
ncbi:hypothetical protein IE53DRAFT_387873 [Violaceomyces palustris]|uniref:Uncharacterized protein n=1 Tax=Violaceomyces palustris TaxID=1673888 RepID=A0ACD0NVR6_9BASI|nr:hypothetical protein IE53DRAFT_387873 [Violaceomyces palustris]